jgi:hypothetical protein
MTRNDLTKPRYSATMHTLTPGGAAASLSPKGTPMSEDKAPRVRIARSTVAGAVCATKFYIGEDEATWPRLTTDTNEFSERIQEELAATGLAYIQTQEYAGQTSDPTVALNMVRQLHASLRDGTWHPGRVGDGGGPSELVLALEIVLADQNAKDPATYPAYTRQQIEDMVEPLNPVEKRKLRSDPMLTAAIADIRRKKADALKRSVRGKQSTGLSLFARPGQAQAAE